MSHDQLVPTIVVDRAGVTVRDHDGTGGSTRTGRSRAWLRAHRSSVLLLTALLAVVGAVQAFGMTGAPQRIDDEGTYVAQAYAVQHFGALTHYTYFYDHPPLGWIQIAGYTWLTDAFARTSSAVEAGREAMLVAFLAGAALLWVLARRLGMSRIAASAAVLIYGLSPLAVQYHRTVYLDNVATPWVLAAFVLALTPRRRLVAFAGAGVCFGIAVLSKETYLLLGPALAWQLWRTSRGTTRRYGVALASSLFVLVGTGYVLLAAVKGELLPGPGHVSLLTGVRFQLFGRAGSGSVFGAHTLAHRVVANWLQLDHVFPAAAVLATVFGLAVRRFRPVAVGMATLLLLMLRPGYLPVPYVIAMLPFGALLVAGVVETALRWQRSDPVARAAGTDGTTVRPVRPVPGIVSRLGHNVRTRPWAPVAVLAAVVGVGFAAPAWESKLRGLFLADLDAPMRQAVTWIDTNVPKDNRLIVDDSLWLDLVRDGYPRNNVVWYYKLDTDPAVEALSPQGWRDFDYVVSTNSLRTLPAVSPEARSALANSTVVATFGTGVQRVEVHRIQPQGRAAATAQQAADLKVRRQAGRELTRNVGLHLTGSAAGELTAGAVGPRLLSMLAGLSAQHTLTVSGFPAVFGEKNTDDPRRQVRITAVDGAPVSPGSRPTRAVETWLRAQQPPYRPAALTVSGGALTVVYSRSTPSGLLGPVGP